MDVEAQLEFQEYQPFDLEPWCNVTLEWVNSWPKTPGSPWIPEAGDPPSGMQYFRGLPFRLPALQGVPAGLGFGPGGYTGGVVIPLRQKARWLIFAHRLLETHLLEDEPAGQVIADYRFQYADGTEVTAPIRERFEIAAVRPRWGQLPFLAVPDQGDGLRPRDWGPWEQLGARQVEVEMPWPRWYVLWAWRNPQPQVRLESVRIEPQARPFLLAALTLSPLEEDPFGTAPCQPVHITLKDPEHDSPPAHLSVEVDRGAATYPYLVPGEPRRGDWPGWGQAVAESGRQAYALVVAQPSATVRLKRQDQVVAAARWGDLTCQGVIETGAARLEVVDRERNWVHVKVVDADTGRPVPCRVHFRSAAGLPYPPHGHPAHMLSDQDTWHIDVGGDLRLGHLTYAYIDGTCQGWLPRGEVVVEAARGFEYEPVQRVVHIQPGQRELTLQLQRWSNLAEQGWFSGDTHVHFLSTLGALLEAQGEDLNAVSLLQSQWGHLFTNTEDFLGRPISTPDGRTVVYTSQENRQHILGHLTLLGLRQPVMPWCSGGPNEAELGGSLETTLSRWADECHAQAGTVILPHFPDPNGETAALIATGRADAVEMLEHDLYCHREYYRYLNGGYRLPLAGGTDKMSARVPVGLCRTYVRIPSDEPFNYENWCKHLRLGQTFITTGPLLRFQVDGAEIGDTLHLPGNGGTVEVAAAVESLFPVHTLEIVQAGQVVAATEDRQGSRALALQTRLKVDRHTWLAARVVSPGYGQVLRHHDDRRRGIMAHSAPIYISVGGDWWMFQPVTAQYMLTLLQGSLEYIRQRSRQYPAGTVTHPHGEPDHLAYLEQPFSEAVEAIHARRRKYGG